ncbi:MAG: hypothetical protein AB9866_21725 [Syntrophobacteraceae bacterium]
MSKPSNCPLCGAKFNLLWRHRHECCHCKKIICGKCAKYSMCLPGLVLKLDFSKKELCNYCARIVTKDLADQELDVVVHAYFTSYECGVHEAKDKTLSEKEESALWDKKYELNKLLEKSSELAKSAADKGFAMGSKEGKRQKEIEEVIEQVSMERLGKAFEQINSKWKGK